MDKDLFIDLEDFAKAFRKEVPPRVRINMKNVFGTAMEVDRHGKCRFEMLCARIPLCPVENGLQADQNETCIPSHKPEQLEKHRQEWSHPWRWRYSQLRTCSHLHA